MPRDREGTDEARLFKASSSRLHWRQARWFHKRSHVHAPKQLLGSLSEAISMLNEKVGMYFNKETNVDQIFVMCFSIMLVV